MAVDIPPPPKPAIVEAAKPDIRERISNVRISFAKVREATGTESGKTESPENTRLAQSGFNQALPFQNFNQFSNFNDFGNFNQFSNFNNFNN